LKLVIEGAATPEEVDLAWMLNRTTPIGPFGLMDYLGLNVIRDGWARERREPDLLGFQAKILQFLNPFVEQNTLGVKTGKGFYNYPKPSYQQPEFYQPKIDLTPIYNSLIGELILAAILIAEKQVATQETIDLAWTVATSLDKGPFEILQEMGVEQFMGILQSEFEEPFHDPSVVAIAAKYLAEEPLNLRVNS